MKKTQLKDLLTGCSLAGKISLRQVVAFYLAFVMMLGVAAPVSASEVIPPVTESIPTEAANSPTETVDAPTEVPPSPTEEPNEVLQEESSSEVQNTLAEDLRSDIEEYIETYQLSVGMTTEKLANAYFVLDADGARAAWETLNEFLERSEGLTAEESAAIWAEENTKLCSRFYNVILQINGPFVAADVTPLAGIRVNTNSNATSSLKDGTLTIQFGSTGCGSNSESTTITIYNETGIDIDLTFKLSVTDGSVNIGTDGNGIATMSIASGKSQAITLTNTAGKKATLKLSDFNFEESSSNTRNITFIYGSGDVTVDNESVGGSGNTVPISLAGATIKITDPNFFGWVNTETDTLITQLAEYTLEPTGDMTIKALYSTNPIFMVGNMTEKTEDGGGMFNTGEDLSYHIVSQSKYYYDDLNAAADAAVTTAGSTPQKAVVLMNNATLPAGDYTIPATVTLLIPFDRDSSLYSTKPGVGAYVQPTAYRTLTMAEGANITVEGAISVSGKHSASQPTNGAPTGPVGYIDMCSDSSITVKAGGKLYAWGYIVGDGTVTITSGASVYEDFQVMDWRGGTFTNNPMLGNKEKVFPISQYYMQNVEVPMILMAGATEYVAMSTDVTLVGMQRPSPIIIGLNSGMFRLSSGYLIKDYDEKKDRLDITLAGNISIENISLTLTITAGATKTIDSKDYVLPLNNMTVRIAEGSKVTVSQSMAMLPDSEAIIQSGANLDIAEGADLFVYDADEWTWVNEAGETKGYCGYTDSIFFPVAYSSSTTAATPIRTGIHDAVLHVAGTLTVMDDSTTSTAAAALYTTKNHAAITGEEGGRIILTGGSKEETYQYVQAASTTGARSIPINTAKLKNRDNSYLSTEGAAANTNYLYDGDTGKWHLAGCTPTSEVTLPTHTQTGSVTSGCDCYGETNETIDKVVMLTAIGASAADEVILDQKFLLPQELIADANATVTVVKQKKVAGITDRKIYNLADITADSADTGAYIDSSGRYVISRGIASGEMTRDVTVQFQYGDGKIVRVRSGNTMADVQNTVARNVRDYAELALTAGNDGQKALITALLTYGGYAQLAFGVDADKPVYDLLTEKNLTIPSIDDVSFTQEVTTSGAQIGITQDKQQAFLDSAIYLRVYFKLDEGASIGDYTFEQGFPIANKDAYQIQLEPGYDAAKGKHYVDIRDIPAAYLDYPYTITVKKGNDSYIVKTSVLAYLTNLIASDRTDIEADKNLAKAMYLYNQAANTYFDR